MPSNTAAWQTAPKVKPLEVKSAPYTSPRENEIVIKNGAVAINPIDWIIQDMGKMMFSSLTYPFILGLDTAGEVVEVGPGVTRFKVGDRVVGHANGTDEKYNSPAHGAFQLYTVLLVNAASPIPSTLSYESAAVLPLGLSTAACGLFQKDQLALQHPSASPKPTGKTLLVWGGATSVGCNAIQLAVAAGYEVFTTCSPKNFDYVKKLGASQAFDYNSKTVVSDLIRAFEGKTTAGAISIGSRAAENCLDILDKCKGDKFISMASYPVPQPPPKNFVILSIAASYLSGMANIWIKSKTRGIRTNFIFGSTLLYNEVGKAIYVDFLPQALAEGTYIAAPDPLVVGKGLEYIQAGYDLQRKGVSAKKIVVSL
ncbi:MAG: hypothetical protein ASARMPRED_000587 [Alectoria sarmentosa]|nr:MAG: hypothetical protein ASARMPRED_000587 [Alectoria sarmentosa]